MSKELGSCELTERVQNGEDVFQLLEDLQGKILHYQVRSQSNTLLNANEDNRWRDRKWLVIRDSGRL